MALLIVLSIRDDRKQGERERGVTWSKVLAVELQPWAAAGHRTSALHGVRKTASSELCDDAFSR